MLVKNRFKMLIGYTASSGLSKDWAGGILRWPHCPCCVEVLDKTSEFEFTVWPGPQWQKVIIAMR